MSQSVKIGGYKLPSNILLAPLSGVSDLAFRLICREPKGRLAESAGSDAFPVGALLLCLDGTRPQH